MRPGLLRFRDAVEHFDGVTLPQQPLHQGAAHQSQAAGDENVHEASRKPTQALYPTPTSIAKTAVEREHVPPLSVVFRWGGWEGVIPQTRSSPARSRSTGGRHPG